MQRCALDQADLILDGWGWQFTHLREAVRTYQKLTGYKGAAWPDWAATLQRLHAAASAEEQQWFAHLPQRQRLWERHQRASVVLAPRPEGDRGNPPSAGAQFGETDRTIWGDQRHSLGRRSAQFEETNRTVWGDENRSNPLHRKHKTLPDVLTF
jgi:hypothetical protein